MRRRIAVLNRVAAALAPAPEAEFRIPMITAWYTGEAVPTPQSFYDAMAVDAANSNTHPHMGPFTHNSVKSGNWSDPTLWDTGTVPGANAVVNVAHDVTYDLESDVPIKDVHVGGAARLRFAAHTDTRLWVDTIMNHGTTSLPEGVDYIPESATPGKPRCEIVFWQSEAPLATTRLGLNTMGPVRLAGAEKTPRLWCPASIPAGATSATIPGLSAAKWRAGDTVVIAATDDAGTSPTDAQYAGPAQFYGPYNGVDAVRTPSSGYQLSRDEPVTVTAVTGDTLYWDAPTQFDHPVYADTLPHGQEIAHRVPVVNLSRSIRLRSADPSSRQSRAHAMFMFSADVDVRYVETKNMGRTDTDPSLARPDGTLAYATDGGTVITDANNVRGRYPLHLHGTGPYFSRQQAVFQGCTAWAPKDQPPIPGWAIVHHNSRAAVEGCAVYNVRGAGLVSELGNEIGQWIGNTVMWARGDGYPASWASRAELWTNHNGHTGVGYESQARQILQQDNVATSCHSAWFFMQQDTDHLKRIADIYSLRLHDPLTQGYGLFGGISPLIRDTYGVEQPQIPDFDDSVAYGCGNLFTVSHRQFTDRTDNTPMISRRCHAVNCRRAFNLINYSFNYSFYDFVYRGAAAGAVAAVNLGNVAWAFSFVNGVIRDFGTGLFNNGIGFNLNGVFVDIDCTNVATPANDFTGDFDITAWQAANPGQDFATQSALAGLEGPWITDTDVSVPGVRWKGILRKGEILNSATDLPRPYPALPRGFGGVEPAPGTPKPYLWIDPASDTSLSPTGTVTFYGAIVDGVGVRAYPETFSSESFGPSTPNYGRPTRTNTGGATGAELIRRNGCFQDAGVWKMRLHVVDHDRLTGEYLVAPVDVTLTGFDDATLLAHEGVPAAPALPLVREAIPLRPLVISTDPPVIVTAATASVAENAPLALVLRAADGQVKWSVTGGADAALFELITADGVSSLRWLGDTTRDYETPQDANADNVYEIEVTATNPFGYAAAQTILVTVRNKEEGVLTPFSDTFNRADEDLEVSPYWLLGGGAPGRLAVASNALAVATAGLFSVYLSPDTGSTDLYVQGAVYGGLVLLAVSVTDELNYVAAGRQGSNVVLIRRVAGVDTTIGSWAGSGNATIRLEYSGGTATVMRNGVTLGAVAVTDGPPATSRAGIVVGTSGPSGTMIDNYAAGAL